MELSGEKNLDCLAKEQIGQTKGCLEENLQGKVAISFILTKDMCPNLLCHKISILFIS